MDDLTSNANWILVYMSLHSRKVLASCTGWYMDGMFKAAAKILFVQLALVVDVTALGRLYY
jgi:hypothetical protein